MRPRLFLLILLIPVILTLPLRAHQKLVAPTLRLAQKRATGILPVKGHGQDGHGTSMSADLKVSATTAISSTAKPFTREQVEGLVRDGLGDESGAKLIEQRGIDFAPSEDFIQTLKAAGASEAFLSALRAAKPPEPASATKPEHVGPALQARQTEVLQHVARGPGLWACCQGRRGWRDRGIS